MHVLVCTCRVILIRYRSPCPLYVYNLLWCILEQVESMVDLCIRFRQRNNQFSWILVSEYIIVIRIYEDVAERLRSVFARQASACMRDRSIVCSSETADPHIAAWPCSETIPSLHPLRHGVRWTDPLTL